MEGNDSTQRPAKRGHGAAMETPHDPEQLMHPLDVAYRAAIVGGLSAIPGTVCGSLYGTLYTSTPILFALVSGAQCFAIGGTFYTARTSILNRTSLLNWWNTTRGRPLLPQSDVDHTPSEKVRASALAGAFTGFSLGFVFRGPRNVIPGTIMFTLFGWGGQYGYNILDAKNSTALKEQAELQATGEAKPKESLLDKIAKSKYSPMSVLTDEQYESMLQEKLLKVEVEIALIDDKIEEIERKARETKIKQENKALLEQKNGLEKK